MNGDSFFGTGGGGSLNLASSWVMTANSDIKSDMLVLRVDCWGIIRVLFGIRDVDATKVGAETIRECD